MAITSFILLLCVNIIMCRNQRRGRVGVQTTVEKIILYLQYNYQKSTLDPHHTSANTIITLTARPMEKHNPCMCPTKKTTRIFFLKQKLLCVVCVVPTQNFVNSPKLLTHCAMLFTAGLPEQKNSLRWYDMHVDIIINKIRYYQNIFTGLKLDEAQKKSNSLLTDT